MSNAPRLKHTADLPIHVMDEIGLSLDAMVYNVIARIGDALSDGEIIAEMWRVHGVGISRKGLESALHRLLEKAIIGRHAHSDFYFIKNRVANWPF
jgi:hypothetical protein